MRRDLWRLGNQNRTEPSQNCSTGMRHVEDAALLPEEHAAVDTIPATINAPIGSSSS